MKFLIMYSIQSYKALTKMAMNFKILKIKKGQRNF